MVALKREKGQENRKRKGRDWRSFAFNTGNFVENSQRLYFKQLWTIESLTHREDTYVGSYFNYVEENYF